MSGTLDRQIRPIYDALETGSNKSAILACNKLLKKQPKNDLVKALKALALVRSQKVEESLVLCDEVLASRPTDEGVMSAMMHVLRGLGRHSDIISMYDAAYKQQPNSEELGAQTFFANARTGNWKAAQQIATKMHKQFQEDRYLYWSIFSAVLQANDPATPANLRVVLLKLAHRLLSSSAVPSYYSADRFYLHLLILRELELYDEAYTLLEHEFGQIICSTSLTCDELRREIVKLKGLYKEEGARAQTRILEKNDRNWLEFLSVLDGTFWDVSSTAEPSEDAKAACKERVSETREFFSKIAAIDGKSDRSGPLALLELEKRVRSHGLSDTTDSVRLAESYFEQFGHKPCCYEDLLPYIVFEGEELSKWTSFLQSQTSRDTAQDLRRTINSLKLQRYNLPPPELTPELESARAAEYVQTYLSSLDFGKGLADTELHPADDLAILAGQAYVSLWQITKDESHLYSASALLEYASARSKQSYKIRLMLIRIYQLLGAPSLALEHYRFMNVKQVQTDTLSHFVLSRASTFSLSPLGDLTYSSECMESSQIYMSNSQETAEFVIRAFQVEKYSQISDFIVFEDRLDNSLQRDLMKVEHVRMRVAHESINAELVDMELIELKFIFDRLHHDNRDFSVLPNYQPRCQPSFNEQTLLFEKAPGPGWLSVFLKIYIRVFQQASDLDDQVEDKLLIGDRPKPSNDPENKLPLKERLLKRKQEELDELTPNEIALLDYATELADWLAPYHDYTRPPPSAVLAEAAKLTELKTGHPLKGLTLQSSTNGSANGSQKKDEEPPAFTEPPQLVSKFFDDMKDRFQAALDGSQLPPELIHIATMTQEGFIIFAIETTRFKPASVVKVNKLGALVQSFKEIRTKAATVLEFMSAELAKLAEQEGTTERRAAFVAASKTIQTSSGFDHDFVLGVAKKVTDARKQIYDGIGKGVAKVCKNHA